MKTVTYEEFLEFEPCWLEEEDGAEQIKTYFNRFGGRMSALDILKLEATCAEDKRDMVLHEELIPTPVLHEFGCVCAEYALSLIEDPDPRCVKAIDVKRAWLRGEATDEELAAARAAAWDAYGAAWEAANAVARTKDCDAARDAAWATSRATSSVACDAAREAAFAAAEVAAEDAVFDEQVAYLIRALEAVV